MDNCPEKVRLTDVLMAMKREQMKCSMTPEQLKYSMTPEQLELQIKLESINSKGKNSLLFYFKLKLITSRGLSRGDAWEMVQFYGPYIFLCCSILSFEDETELTFLFRLLKMSFGTIYNSFYGNFLRKG